MAGCSSVMYSLPAGFCKGMACTVLHSVKFLKLKNIRRYLLNVSTLDIDRNTQVLSVN